MFARVMRRRLPNGRVHLSGRIFWVQLLVICAARVCWLRTVICRLNATLSGIYQ